MSLLTYAKRGLYTGLTGLLGDDEGFVVLKVLRGPARGIRLRLRLKSMSEGSMVIGRYEPRIARAFARLVRPGWTVWDGGAFIGYYSLLFSRLVGPTGRVVAFEPDPGNHARTRENIALNSATNIQTARLALGDDSGELAFVATRDQTSHLAGTYVGSSSLKGTEVPDPMSVVRVRCVSPDSAHLKEGLPLPDFIKLDLEGAETEALKHLDFIVGARRPTFVVELHNPEAEAAMNEFIRKYDYSMRWLVPGICLAESAGVACRFPTTPEQ